MGKILYGDVIANEVKDCLKVENQNLNPSLAIVIVGEDYGSLRYVNSIVKNSEQTKIKVMVKKYKDDITQEELLREIKKLNKDISIDGILVQMPLPRDLNSEEIIQAIDYHKDVEGIHPTNLGLLFSNQQTVAPCTAKSVIRILDYYDISIAGKSITIIGRSISVGKPLAMMLTNMNATVTLCHSKTINLKEITKNTDIIIVAIGKSEFLDLNYINKDSIVIDVGINFKDDKMCGDADFNNLKDRVQAITPVPKGVGSLTIAMLMENLKQLVKNNRG